MLDFIRDLYASFKQTSLERVKSPVLGAFVFCWLGFNWEILAILFLSKQPIESRLLYISQNFDLLLNLMGAISITTLICYFLPRINKFVTKIQDEPNSETVILTLTSKIKIAEQQQKIAEIDARKKLAEKKEDIYINNNIYQIKNDNLELKSEIDSMKEEISSLNASLNQSYVAENRYKEMLEKAQSTITELKESNSEFLNSQKILQDQLSQARVNEESMHNASYKRDEQMMGYTIEIENRKDEIRNLKLTINKQEEKYKLFAKTYPLYFTITNIDDICSLDITPNLIEDYNARNKNALI